MVTLRQLLSVMSDNTGVMVKLFNLNDTELITFNIVGYATIESDVLDRKVKLVKMQKTPSEITLKVTIFDAEDTVPDTND